MLQKDKPWIFRTYAGHSSAKASNELFRMNLAKGQTGLSVAFDLPTQTGYDPDHVLARGEVGKVGVPVPHLGAMRELFDGLRLDSLNTSMTINAPAAWLLSLYVALADEQGADRKKLAGTTQNDIIKEYLSRGTYVFPPRPSLKLTTDTIAFTTHEMPKWNPMNVCSYHLQEAGATPEQELSFALATAITILDAVKASGQIKDAEFPQVVAAISFFVNAGIRFITELCKMRAFTELWDELLQSRYGIEDAKARRFRYGVQVNSLGLTEDQPENNVYRILLEMLAVTLSKSSRARAVQLPAWNEALGLPRPWDQQWSLRMQQVLAYETDLLEFGDIFAGSTEIANKVAILKQGALAELARIEAMGGAIAAVEKGYMKQALVASNAARLKAIEAGDITIVGVNAFRESEASPLAAGEDAIVTVKDDVEVEEIERLKAWRAARDENHVKACLKDLANVAKEDRNIMEASIACAKAGVTTGEWGQTLREVFGEHRAPTGISSEIISPDHEGLEEIRARVAAISEKLGHKMRFLVGKPGLDGHSNGAEQITVRARETGMDVIYEGIRSTPAEIIEAAKTAKPDVIGLSILSGSHVPLARDVMNGLRAAGLGHIPVVIGGIIPSDDEPVLKQLGIAEIYTPKDFELNRIMSGLTLIVEGRLSGD